MTLDLFTNHSESSSEIDLPGAQLRLIKTFLQARLADEHFQHLVRETPWREEDVFVWGKWHKPPRMISWYGDPGASYGYSGSKLSPLPWTPRLVELRELVKREAAGNFNSVLLNLYRDGNDRMGWHSDNEPELGPRPVIASLNFGAAREILFKHRTDKTLGVLRIPLTHGSLLLMSGDTQVNWQHAINKEARLKANRINLTFRLITPVVRRGSINLS